MIQVELKVVPDIECFCNAICRDSPFCRIFNVTFLAIVITIVSCHLELDELTFLLTCIDLDYLLSVPNAFRPRLSSLGSLHVLCAVPDFQPTLFADF